MALDTQAKRMSVVAASLYVAPSVLPDGSFNQGDRQAIGFGYSGIAVGAPPVVSPFDTQAKRMSLIAIPFYPMTPSVLPDGSFSQGDRQVIGYGYITNLVGGGPTPSGKIPWHLFFTKAMEN